MSKVADLDEVKEVALQYLDAKEEASLLKKKLTKLFEDTDVELTEILANGGTITYKITQPKPKFDYVSYSAFLVNALKKGEKYTDEELFKLMNNFTIQKAPKWSLKITK